MQESLDPKTIIIADRQRQAPATVDDQFIASVLKYLIHPITLQTTDDGPKLVTGFRRLSALIAGNVNPILHQVHYRFVADLNPLELEILELEENREREDLFWKDEVRATARLHDKYMQRDPTWNMESSAREMHVDVTWVRRLYLISQHLDTPLLSGAGGINQATGILQNAAERKLSSMIGNISAIGASMFQPTVPVQPPTESQPDDPNGSSHTVPVSDPDRPIPPPNELLSNPTQSVSDTRSIGIVNSSGAVIPLSVPIQIPVPVQSILCMDFFDWIEEYSGPKFTVLHCDFPYGVEYENFAASINQPGEYDNSKDLFFRLLDSLCINVDRIASYSSHMIFWFHMNFYDEVMDRLTKAGWWVHKRPLIWGKTDNSGIVPGVGNQYMRWTYENAFLCSRGKRPLIQAKGDFYPAPTASKPIHPTEKSEAVLHHFLSALVDDTTDFFDPTCGSGSSLRAAERLGARSVLGLERDPTFASSANHALTEARKLRNIRI